MSTTIETSNSELVREKTLDAAKKHKASWIELGQYLYAISKDKLFKTWGYLAFETYCMKELNMKKTTASKLLKSYFFLEQEEPRLVDPSLTKDEKPATLPDPESVNLLRLAKDNKDLTPQDYAEVRESVIDEAKDPKEVRAQVKKLLSEREEKDPAEVRRERRNAALKRVVTVLKNVKMELKADNLLPEPLLKEMTELAQKLQEQVEE